MTTEQTNNNSTCFDLSEYKKNLSASIEKWIKVKQDRLNALKAEELAEQRRQCCWADGKSEYSD